jgi:flagellar biosynthesis/type III secretory pathway chaperone
MNPEEALAKILNEQVNGYKELLELLQKERQDLIDFNAGSIEELYKGKDVLILRLRLLEEERIRLMKDVGSNTMTLKALAEKTGNSAFLELRSKLKSLVQAIEELNSFNRILIDRSLGYLKTNAHFFDIFGMNEGRPQKGMLLSKEM